MDWAMMRGSLQEVRNLDIRVHFEGFWGTVMFLTDVISICSFIVWVLTLLTGVSFLQLALSFWVLSVATWSLAHAFGQDETEDDEDE